MAISEISLQRTGPYQLFSGESGKDDRIERIDELENNGLFRKNG
jgi:hypothetical protein